MTDTVEVSRIVAAPPRRVADLFWDIHAWQAIWEPWIRYLIELHATFRPQSWSGGR